MSKGVTNMRVSAIFRTAAYFSILAVFAWSLTTLPTAHANSLSPWLSNNPEIEADQQYNIEERNELKSLFEGINAGNTCTNRKVQINKKDAAIKKYLNSCWYNAPIGLVSDGGQYLYGGGGVAYEFMYDGLPGNRPYVQPTANPKIVIEKYQPTPLNSSWRLRAGSALATRTDDNWGGQGAGFAFSNPSTLELRTESGFPRGEAHTTSQWSSDRRYLMQWDGHGNLYRIDTETFESMVVKVNDPGTWYKATTTISPSGRYAAVLSSSELFIVDYSTCSVSNGNHNKVGINCQIRKFSNPLYPITNTTGGMELIRFHNDHTISFLHRKFNSTGKFTQYYMRVEPKNTSDKYLALGDSYSSGEGAGSYLAGTDLTSGNNRNMCHTSTDSYPFVISRHLSLASFISVACSGAKIEHYTNVVKYIDSENVFPVLHPGKIFQREAVDSFEPNIITIGLSGNDIGFKDKITKCLSYSTNCFTTYESRKEIALEIQKEHPLLVNMYGDIMKRMGQNRRLYVLGYPQIVSSDPSKSCGRNVSLSTKERQMAEDLIEYFNAVIRSAADQAGAYYVDIEDSLVGYKLCESTNSNVAVNGLTAGRDGNRIPISNASFHPNQLGHKLIKDAILQKTENFTKNMPNKLPKNIPNPENFSFLSAPKDGGIIRNLYNNTSNELSVLIRGTNYLLKIANPSIPLAPNSIYNVVLRSDPVRLGTVTTDGAGFIESEITIPEDTEPGLHSLHVQGLDVNGEPIDAYEYVYVAASADDFDGDGIPDVNEPCGGMIQESGLDADKDGIDDACDAEIGEAPLGDSDTIDALIGEKNRSPIIGRSTEIISSSNVGSTPISGSNEMPVVASRNTANPMAFTNPELVLTAMTAQTNPTLKSQSRATSSLPKLSLIFALGSLLLFIVGYTVFKYGKQKN